MNNACYHTPQLTAEQNEEFSKAYERGKYEAMLGLGVVLGLIVVITVVFIYVRGVR